MDSSQAAYPGVAVFGCGYWGMNHVRVWRDLGLLRAVVDPDITRRASLRELYPEIESFASADEVLERPDINAVVIATPAVTHTALALRAMDAGKDILVEKPIAVHLADGQRVVEAAEAGGRILMVGHVLEYHPAVLRLRALVDDGVLGRVQYVYSNRLSFGILRTEENALWSFAPHDIALCLRLLKQDPEDVSCRGGSYLSPGVADVTTMAMSFPSRANGHIFVSWLHPFKEQRFVVVGSRQMAVFDDAAPWDKKLVLYPHEVVWSGSGAPMARKAAGVAVELDPKEPLVAECEHFRDAVVTRVPPLTDGVSALRVLRVLEAGEKSLAQGGAPVRIADEPGSAQGLGLPDVFVEPTATVDEGAKIGPGTKVWHYSHVMSTARIGANCSLGQNCYIAGNVVIGDNVKIQNNVSVYEGVELEDGVFCGPSAVFTNVINPRAEVERKDEYRPTLIRRGASLGANCTIICGATVGEYALVGAGAVVRDDVPAHALVVGVPATIVGWVSHAGVRLHFTDGLASCPESGRRYRLDGETVVEISES